MTFCDGSAVAYACISYLCWPTKHGVHSTLVSMKTRVAPLKLKSILRIELLGCVAATRLATSIENALPFQISSKRFMTDSTVALRQICSKSVILNVYNSHRVAEIQSNSRLEDWRWVPGHENIVDIATRPNCQLADLAPGSTYQNGPEWLVHAEDDWPVKNVEQVKHSLPKEELNSKLSGLQCMMATVIDNKFWKFLKENTVTRVLTVLKCCNKWLKVVRKQQGVALDADSNQLKLPKFVLAAHTFLAANLQQNEQDKYGEDKYNSLMLYKVSVKVDWPLLVADSEYKEWHFDIIKMRGRGNTAVLAVVDGVCVGIL